MQTSGKEPLSLYIHIPFCSKKCPYCHFYVIPDHEGHKDLLLESLLLEWAVLIEPVRNYEIVSIYFGGGTPSLFGPERIDSLLSRFRTDATIAPDCEVTLEANPENLTLSLAKSYHDIGINRMSIGIQSLSDSSLITLGRTHSSHQACQAISSAHQVGITNLSVDLMFELPDQTLQDFAETLEQLTPLPITHLSLYNLTIEPHTVFNKKRDTLNLPSEEEGRAMLDLAVESLDNIGLKRYEISAFAKPGFHSNHNTGYWTGRPFFGLGPSAFSYYGGKRLRNCANLHRYAKALKTGISPIDFTEELPYPRNVCELLTVRLRMLEGAHLPDYDLPPETHTAIRTQIEGGFLSQHGQRLSLTDKGLLFYDLVASELV